MTDEVEFLKSPGVRFVRRLPGPIERVWELISTPGRLPEWFGEGEIEPRVGGAVSLMDGHIRGVVTQWDPPHKLAYTWNVFSPGEARSAYPESYLTLELGRDGQAVRLTLTHLPVLDRFEKQNAMGWATFLDLVEAAAQGEIGRSRVDAMKANAGRFGVDLRNLIR